jgi:nucleotide-binding universal stress UspA family protein
MTCDKPIFERILVAVDRSAASRQALQLGAGLAALTGARVALVHVMDISKDFEPELGFADDPLTTDLRRAADELLACSQSMFPSGLRIDRLIRDGDPPAEILAAADSWVADLIIVGNHSRGHGRLSRLLFDGTAESIVRDAHCPVLTVGCASVTPLPAAPPFTPAHANAQHA